MKTLDQRQGIVLLEILVGLIVFSVGVVVLVQSLSFLVRSNRRLRQQITAAILAENIFNRCLSGELIDTRGVFSSEMAWIWESDRINEHLRNYSVTVHEPDNERAVFIRLEGGCMPLAGQ